MGNKHYGYWNIKENVIREAKKYKTRRQFQLNCCGAYQSAIRNGWIDEMDWLIPKEECYSGHNYVYVYIDEKNKVAYVGLTSDKERRHKEHTRGEYNGDNYLFG